MQTLTPYVPMILAVAGGVAAMLLGAWGRRTASVWVAVVGLTAGAVLAAARLTPARPLDVVGRIDPIIVAACLGLAAVVLAGSSRVLTRTLAGERVIALATLAAAACALAGTAHDVVVLFLAVESLALLGYAMVALGGTDRAREAAMKWFVQGSIATAVFVVGLAVLVGVGGGATAYAGIGGGALANPAAATVGCALVLAALLFKAGAFPFHSWMPDAFETAPAPAAAVLASAGKIGPITAVVYLVASFPDTVRGRMVLLLAAVSLASIVFGNLAALRQRSVARLLAYSGIAQVGYALAGLVVPAASLAVLLFAIVYAVAAAASFVALVAVREHRPGWDGSVDGLAGLAATDPVLAGSVAIVMLSLTGIPLTAGFWAKFAVFGVALGAGYAWLVVVGMLGSVVSFGYYGALLRSIYMDAGEREVDDVEPQGADMAAGPERDRLAPTTAVAALALVIVIAGVLPFVLGLTSLTAVFV